MDCPRGLAKASTVGCTIEHGASANPPQYKVELDVDELPSEPLFDFARTKDECCRPDGGFWSRMVQLNDPVRQKGRKPTIQHDRLITHLFRQLAANCPCKGMVWIGIGVHELKHGRPW